MKKTLGPLYDHDRYFLVPKYVLDDEDIDRLMRGAEQLITESMEDDDNTELVILILHLREEREWRDSIRIPASAVAEYREHLLARNRRRRKH